MVFVKKLKLIFKSRRVAVNLCGRKVRTLLCVVCGVDDPGAETTMNFSRSARLRLLLAVAATLAVVTFFRLTGLYLYFCQENYFSDRTFHSPEVSRSIGQLRLNVQPDVKPVVNFDYGFRLRTTSKCANASVERVDLLLVVKSAVDNVANRMAIRMTWGQEKRFQGYVVQLVFLVALVSDDRSSYTQEAVEEEQRSFGDLVQGNFTDRYYNNTLKTVMGFGWAAKHCPAAEFIMFIDDDFYVSTRNVLRLIDNPLNYPSLDVGLERRRREVSPMAGQAWYTGHLFFILPVRFYYHKFFVSLDEYPYNVFPPFINAGAFLLTRHTLVGFYYAAMYTPPMKLDDVYVGILAKKTDVIPTHNRYFYPYRVPSSKASYEHLIASHGFRNPTDLIRVWNEQVEHGNA